MDFLYAINHLVFSAFMTLFILEFGVACLLLIDYDGLKDKLRSYINPIWGITGTFAVFYLLSTAVTYPALMGIVGNVFIVPLFVVAFFILLRNAFMAYSEYIGGGKNEKLYLRFFSISTIVIAFVLMSTFATAISEVGYSNLQLDLSFMANPYNISLFISIALIAIAASVLYFDIRKSEKFELLAAAIGLALLIIPTAVFAGYMRQGIVSYWYLIVADIVFLAVIATLGYFDKKIAGPLVMLWLFLSVNLFCLVQYPYLLGGKINLVDYLVNPATGFYDGIVTAVIFALLVVSLPILMKFVYANRRGY
ncbi:MAG: cytochrome d ubiquinol oxidase subunit II [Candidatus Micrarchaeota archaeon]|nr:cytochrome d ubiquinol oxidase subunit II [Candidatus Micrarchaeota archaeon]